MGLIDDILKGLPANAVLREQITQLNAQKAAAETENAILKDDLRQAKAEIAKLKKQIEEFPHKDNLDEVEIKLLLEISKHRHPNRVRLARENQISRERVDYHLGKLVDSKYLSFRGFDGDGIYTMEQKG